jgi:hypothetical protein
MPLVVAAVTCTDATPAGGAGDGRTAVAPVGRSAVPVAGHATALDEETPR